MKPVIRGLLALSLVPALMLASCQTFIALLVAKSIQTQDRPAKYPVPGGKKILALVESSLCETDQPVARMLTERLNKEMEKQKIAAKTVPYEALLELAAATPGFSKMEAAEIGKKLGADIVCYVLIHEFKLKDEVEELWRGEFRATVSMVDVATGRQLWPMSGHEGYWVKPVRAPVTSSTSPDYAAELSRALCDTMADRIAKLFYDHRVPIDEPEEDTPETNWEGY